VTIPAELEQIDESCFSFPHQLGTVLFDRASKLACISAQAFAHCRQPQVILLPHSVKTIKSKCYYQCHALFEPPLAESSEGVRIHDHAFAGCRLWKSMILRLPSSLEFVGQFCFEGCDLLSNLTFTSSSHLRELLALPPDLSGFVSIPDSVEILSFHGFSRETRALVFSFGSRFDPTRSNVQRDAKITGADAHPRDLLEGQGLASAATTRSRISSAPYCRLV
jgi:hypothetical protein